LIACRDLARRPRGSRTKAFGYVFEAVATKA
jgi:hypothetical protein